MDPSDNLLPLYATIFFRKEKSVHTDAIVSLRLSISFSCIGSIWHKAAARLINFSAQDDAKVGSFIMPP
jgi:hypothetical protein